ncbi:MAG: 1,4-dihydroxy-6-naphthoate synthase [Chitinophagaceae bacterium]
MKFTLGFSPCPNDTFIFDALVNQKIDTEGFEFNAILEDVETLNQWTLQGKLDITKLSFPAFFRATDKYVMMNSGSALGKGVGPLLVTNSKFKSQKSKNEAELVEEAAIALPGINTTANLLFSFAYPKATNKKFMIFSAIEDAVVNGEADLGVIIHENRFTYQQKGLHKVTDLGEHWEEKMKAPIPLGGIVIKRNMEKDIQLKVDRLIRKSLEYAFANYPLVTDYVKAHSQAMSEEVMRKHIDLYVNNYSIDLGSDGKKAIQTLYDVFLNNNQDVKKDNSLFL